MPPLDYLQLKEVNHGRMTTNTPKEPTHQRNTPKEQTHKHRNTPNDGTLLTEVKIHHCSTFLIGSPRFYYTKHIIVDFYIFNAVCFFNQ